MNEYVEKYRMRIPIEHFTLTANLFFWLVIGMN